MNRPRGPLLVWISERLASFRLNPTVTCAAVQLNSALVNYTESARHTLRCDTGFCVSLPMKYDQFSSAVCGDVVPGIDIYWTSLLLILVVSLLIVPLSLLLASRFIDLNEKANRSAKFHLTSAIIRQLRATFWLTLSISINLWLVVHISRDGHFHSHCRDTTSGCCASCVWGFGILFLLLAVAVGGVSRVYQGIVVYRIKSEWREVIMDSGGVESGCSGINVIRLVFCLSCRV